jgi:hypothetical protein
MVTLLLDRIRRVELEEARRVVLKELGEESGASVTLACETAGGMSYIEWKHGSAHYHLGTSDFPYTGPRVVPHLEAGEATVDASLQTPPPRQQRTPHAQTIRQAWTSHRAFLYVDALLFHVPPQNDRLHFGAVLRIASHFVDDRCTLLWLYGSQPEQAILPTPQSLASLRAGLWPSDAQ